MSKNPIPPVELTPHAAVIEAWALWDERPGAYVTAADLCDAISRYAPELGLTTTEFRRRVSAARRSGLGPDMAIDLVRDEIRNAERAAA